MDALWLELGKSVARAGPYVGGAVLVFSMMVWMAAKRRMERRTDEIILLTGAAIVVALLVKLFM